MKTYTARPETIQRDWFIVDATNQALGRLATKIARRLHGKHKPEYTPHIDTGDYIVVINAGQVRVIGAKTTNKVYYHHSDSPGGIKSINFEKLITKTPERVIETVVKGILPGSPLSRDMYHKLKMYKGASHPRTARQLQGLKI